MADLKLAVIEIGGWPMRVEQAAAAEFESPTPPPPSVRPTSEEAVLIMDVVFGGMKRTIAELMKVAAVSIPK